MALQAMWVHGHSATIEHHDSRQWTPIEGLRVGWGVVYRCQDNSSYWFHFAIPTPVIDDGVRARLRRVMVLFTTDPAVTLNAVHVWDGPTSVFAQNGLAIGGANTTLVEGRNSFALPDHLVFWGIGISVLFHFADAGNVTLHTAGIDFES